MNYFRMYNLYLLIHPFINLLLFIRYYFLSKFIIFIELNLNLMIFHLLNLIICTIELYINFMILLKSQ